MRNEKSDRKGTTFVGSAMAVVRGFRTLRCFNSLKTPWGKMPMWLSQRWSDLSILSIPMAKAGDPTSPSPSRAGSRFFHRSPPATRKVYWG